jgi:hypothetical protein
MHHYCLWDDLTIITNDIQTIQPQIHKLQKFAKLSHIEQIQIQPNHLPSLHSSPNITYKTKNFPTLTRNEPYTYPSIHRVPSLKWDIQKDITTNKAKKIKKTPLSLTGQPQTKHQNPTHCNETHNRIPHYAILFQTIHNKARQNITQHSHQTKLLNAHKIQPTTSPTSPMKILAFPYFVNCIGQQLPQALNDPCHLGIITKALPYT